MSIQRTSIQIVLAIIYFCCLQCGSLSAQSFTGSDAYFSINHSLGQSITANSDFFPQETIPVRTTGIFIGNHYNRFLFATELNLRSPVGSGVQRYLSLSYFSLGLVVRDKKRIQFPLLLNTGYECYQIDDYRRRGFKYGAQAGMNVFITRTVYLNLMGEYNRVAYKARGYDERGTLINTGFKIGIGKFIIQTE